MARITLEGSLASQLIGITQPVELCDSAGRVFGRFVPLVDQSQWEPITADISEEELERRSKSSERRYKLAEVQAHLEKL